MRRFSGVRLAAVGSVLACVLALIPALPASAPSERNSDPNNYLALGDSVTFGYNPLLLAEPVVNPSSFVGYPQLASNLFRPKLNDLFRLQDNCTTAAPQNVDGCIV
jgi:hypothetical protein